MVRRVAILLSLFLPVLAYANGPLRSIVIFGNEKTERGTILSIINVEPQTYINRKLIREIDDRLVNCGLFKSVRVKKVNNKNGTVDIRIWVAEKQLWFVFPTFAAWSGRFSGGLVFGESNMFFANAGTLTVVEGGNRLSRFFHVIDARNIFDTNYTFRFWGLARSDDIPLFIDQTKADEINLKDVAVAVSPGFQWTNDIRTTLTFKYRRVDYGLTTGVIPVAEAGRDGDDVSVSFEFMYDSLKRREAFLKGTQLMAKYEFADTRFGTDFTYQIESVSLKYAERVFKHFNYVTHLEGSIGNDLPFHRDITLGASSLRGYQDRQFRGDTMIRLQQDVLFRLFGTKMFSLFGTVFYDLGLLYFENNGIGRSSFNSGAGGGLRVSLKEIIAPVLGFDVAYGLEDKELRMYFALGLVRF